MKRHLRITKTFVVITNLSVTDIALSLFHVVNIIIPSLRSLKDVTMEWRVYIFLKTALEICFYLSMIALCIDRYVKLIAPVRYGHNV